MEDLLNYANPAPTPPPPPPAAGLRARVTYSAVNVRSGPGVNYEDIGDLQQGDVLNIRTFTGKSLWVKVKAPNLPATSWCAFALEGDPFITLTPGDATKGRVDYLLNVRDRPSTDGAVVGRLSKGDMIEILDLQGRDVWLEFELGKWAAFANRGFVYMETIPK
jgi:hypothetical protein